MNSDTDFDEVATEITEHAMAMGDPQMAMMIDKWLTKLTVDNRGLNELNYLRLLQHMMVQRRVSQPFVSPPPEGPLLPLTRYLNQPERSRDSRDDHYRSKNDTDDGVAIADNDDEVNSAVDRDEVDGADDGDEDGVDDDDDDDDKDDDNNNKVWNYASVDTCILGQTCREDEVVNTSAIVANVVNREDVDADKYEDRGGTDGLDDDKAVTTFVAIDSAWTKRDGHLAAAGEHREDAKSGNRDAGRFDKLCDPCVDGTGPRGRETLHGKPFGAAYKSLLGDCALPVFTEAEKKKVGSELLQVLENVDDDTTLQDFYYQVSQYTCDQGVMMMKVSESMVDDFRTFVSDVFESRTEHISDGLSKEQTSLNEKYTYLRDRALNRATVALDFLREALPVFNWHKYHSEPEAYMKREILRRVPPSSGDSSSAADGSGTVTQDKAMVADGGEDEDDGQQQSSTIKKLLYSLNWMRTEVARVDCEASRLYSQRERLTAGLVATNEKRTAAQCRAANDIDRHQSELTLLRHKSNEQSKIIDRLVETIQLMQAKQPSSSVTC